MIRFLPASLSVLFFPFSLISAEWEIEDNSPALAGRDALIYQRKIIRKKGETSLFGNRIIQLVWFDDRNADLKVIDNGAGENRNYPNLAAAMEANICTAGCNGGFFLKNYAPSGLMISNNTPVGKWGTAKLLSGAVLVDGSGRASIIRRSEYQPGTAKELIQAGPFLIDRGAPVKGLSNENSRRRTFVLHDGGHRFALGMSDAFTLAELSDILSRPGAFSDVKIHRALNLDGGTSSGFFYDRGRDYVNIHVEPFKRVRNFLGISPRK